MIPLSMDSSDSTIFRDPESLLQNRRGTGSIRRTLQTIRESVGRQYFEDSAGKTVMGGPITDVRYAAKK